MRLLQHIWRSRPSLLELFSAAIIWGAVIPFCILADYLLWRHMLPPAVVQVSAIFAIGAFFSAPVSLWLTKICVRPTLIANFALSFFLLGAGTIGLSALVFAFDFWLYFAQWHSEPFSKLWANQLVFTFASAIYQFLVSGLRLYLPFGLIALVMASLWASKRITR